MACVGAPSQDGRLENTHPVFVCMWCMGFHVVGWAYQLSPSRQTSYSSGRWALAFGLTN